MEINFSIELKPFEVMVKLLTRRGRAWAQNADFHFVVSGGGRINLSVPFMLLTMNYLHWQVVWQQLQILY